MCGKWNCKKLLLKLFKSKGIDMADAYLENLHRMTQFRRVSAVPQFFSQIGNLWRFGSKPKLILHYINKDFEGPENNLFADTFDPSTGEVLCQFPYAGQDDVCKAVQAAKDAFAPWSTMTEEQRKAVLIEVAALLQNKVDVFEQAEAMDWGQKVDYKVAIVEEVLKIAQFTLSNNHCKEMDKEGSVSYVDRLPLGVVVIVTSWSSSFPQLLQQLVPALLSGNTVVIKVSSQAPLTGHYLAHLLYLAGFPKGVVNIVFGEDEKTIAAVVGHQDVAAVVVVGSDKNVIEFVKENIPLSKKVLFSTPFVNSPPMIVFDDADLDRVIPTATEACFLSDAGQTLHNVHHVIVHKNILEKFKYKFIEATAQLSVGGTAAENPSVGPLISCESRDRLLELIMTLKDNGTQVLCGGCVPALTSKQEKGFFIRPTLLAGSDSGNVSQEVIQGPVVKIISFETEEEVIASTINCEGLISASIWTRDVKRARDIASRLNTGCVFINDWKSNAPRVNGDKAVDFYTYTKNINIKL